MANAIANGKTYGLMSESFKRNNIDMDAINKDMQRRAPGKNKMSTQRKEADEVEILSGVLDGYTTGAPLCGIIKNTSQHSRDYSYLKDNIF